jgi:hypothetical protein
MENKDKQTFTVGGNKDNQSFNEISLQKMMEKFSSVDTYISGDYIYKPEYSEKQGRGNFIQWGNDNLFPQHLINVLNNVPEHSAAAKKYTDLIAGGGIQIPNEVSSNYKTFIGNEQGEVDLIGTLFRASYDLNAFGGFAFEIQWAKNGKNIAYINQIPLQKLRKAVECKENEVDGWMYSENWSNIRKHKPIFIPSFDPTLAKSDSKQIYFAKQYVPGIDVYCLPSYFPILNWLLLEYNIGLFHISNIRSGFKPSIVFSFGMQPEQGMQDAISNKLKEKYSGAENAGEPILLFAPSSELKPEITTIQPNSNDSQYQAMIDIVTQKILTGWRVTNPEILGIPSSKGINTNGNDMLIAEYRLQKTVIDQLQFFVEKHINYLAGFNNIYEPILLNKYMDDEKFKMTMGLYTGKAEEVIAEVGPNSDEKQQIKNVNN